MLVEVTNRHEAANLYWQGFKVAEIAIKLALPYQTLDSWKRRDKWDEASVATRVKTCTNARLIQLISKEEKTDRDFKEIDSLGKTLERMARIEKFQGEGGKPSDINPKLKNKGKGKKGKNHLTDEQIDQLVDAYEDSLFDYQKTWERAKKHRIRNILKSRQIGATWYFAREAFIDALLTGDNQIFLSASKNQAHVFKNYILDFVKEVTGVELKGDPIKLGNGATLYFLGTSSKTAQSYHGHLYFDEYFWTNNFKTLRKVASGMAIHKKWRQTYISTPSTVEHEAYAYWTGKQFNQGRPSDQKVKIDVTHANLKAGKLCKDGQWRQMVTVEDAVAGGCDLFDIDALQAEYSTQEYKNLLMCEFIDGAASIFTLRELQNCQVDSLVSWRDYLPHGSRPLGDLPVWVGYDPSRTRDNASIVVVAPPKIAGGKFRVVEKASWSNLTFEEQTNRIKKIIARYNVQAINIDASGMGIGVYELVKKIFPRTRKIIYSVESKTRMVIKAMHLIQNRQVEFDAGWSDMVASLLSIHRSQTANSRQITYSAGRTAETGHADTAWALFHAFDEIEIESAANLGGKKKGSITYGPAV